MKSTVTFEMDPVQMVLKKKGLHATGDVQQQLTNIVNRRITKYMPFQSGALSTKLKRVVSPTEILILGPYARVQYYGEVMIDPATNAAGFLTSEGWRSRKGAKKVPSGRSMTYDTTKHPAAGPYWDRRLVAAEKGAIAEELQRYMNGRKGDGR